MTSKALSLYAGNARSRRCGSLRMAERSKLIVGTALVFFELVAAAGMFGWLDGQDRGLSSAGVNIEHITMKGATHDGK